MGSRPVRVGDVLDGHVGLDLECLDRIYLDGYVPNLQVGGQVVSFMTAHLGSPIPSPAIFDKIGSRFRRDVARFAEVNDIPVVRFAKGDRKIEVMRPYLARAAASGRSGGAAIGWPRSSRRCSPRPSTSATVPPPGSGSSRPTGG